VIVTNAGFIDFVSVLDIHYNKTKQNKL